MKKTQGFSYLSCLLLAVFLGACGAESKKKENTSASPTATSAPPSAPAAAPASDQAQADPQSIPPAPSAPVTAQPASVPAIDWSQVDVGSAYPSKAYAEAAHAFQPQIIRLNPGEYLGGSLVFPSGRYVPYQPNRSRVIQIDRGLPELPEMNLFITMPDGTRAKVLDQNRVMLPNGQILRDGKPEPKSIVIPKSHTTEFPKVTLRVLMPDGTQARVIDADRIQLPNGQILKNGKPEAQPGVDSLSFPDVYDFAVNPDLMAINPDVDCDLIDAITGTFLGKRRASLAACQQDIAGSAGDPHASASYGHHRPD